MLYAIYQAETRGVRFEVSPTGNVDLEKDYVLVAVVQADDLRRVFTRCQHNVNPWYRRDGVIRIADYTFPIRSLSVGDVVKDEGGTLWQCAPVGWNEVYPMGVKVTK